VIEELGPVENSRSAAMQCGDIEFARHPGQI
jgi:hypothetical protein